MTVASETCYAELDWTGVETTFNPAFSALDATHVLLSYKDSVGTITPLVAGTHLTVAKAGATGAAGAITATPIALPTAPGTVIFERQTPATNTTNFADLSKYSADTHTMLADAAAMRAAENRRKANIGVAAVDTATAQATIATNKATEATASATAAAASAAALQGTSTTSVTPGAGSKAFATQGGKSFAVGRKLLVTSDSDPANIYMEGTSTAYDAVTGALTIAISAYAGSGAHVDWTINVSGSVGPAGPVGPAAVARRNVRVRSTANVDIAAGGLAAGTTHDGVVVATGEVVLLMAQTAPAENGVYDVPAAGAATRNIDFDTYAEYPGVVLAVEEGTDWPDTVWLCTSNDGGTLGVTALDFVQVSPYASAAETQAGAINNKGVTPASGAASYEALGKTRGGNVQTADYTLVLTDAGRPVRMNVATANSLTVPPNADVAFDIDTYVNIEQYGAGQTTITAGAGVTIRARNGTKMGGQYAMGTLHKIAADEWMLGGDVTT